MRQTGSAERILKQPDDEAFVSLVAKRLQAIFERSWGEKLLFGRVVFIFHEGRFQCVEEQPRRKMFFRKPRYRQEER